MSGLVTIFGCGGFLGRYVAEEALDRGWRVRAAERNPANATRIKPLGNLGQTQFISTDILNASSVARAVAGADAVVNLVGTFGSSMQAIHVDGARNIAQAALDAGVRQLVHISAIGADAQSPARYGQTKAAGEQAVKEAFPDATILRPSVAFGPEDEFINRFAALIRTAPVVPVISGDTKFQPVFAGDIGKAIGVILDKPQTHAGAVYELGGPEVLSMRELFEWIAQETGRDRTFIDVPDFAAKAIAIGTGFLPNAPIDTDQLKMLSRDNVAAAGTPGFETLGISPISLKVLAPRYLTSYRNSGRFGRRLSA